MFQTLLFFPCSLSDPNFEQCCLEHGRQALPEILKGDKKYKIPKLVPLFVPSLTVDTGEHLKILLKNITAYGLENIILEQVKMDATNKKITIRASLNMLSMIGKYSIDGRILILPIKGDGDINITSIDGHYQYDAVYTLDTVNGEEHIVISDDDKLTFKLKRAIFQLDNLFNGDAVLGGQMNKFLNENWSEVIDEIGGAISQTVRAIIRVIGTSIFSQLSFKDLFLDVYAKKLPLIPSISPCHRSDPQFDKCAVKHGAAAIPRLLEGDKKYGIPLLAPLSVPYIEINTGENYKVSIRDAKIHLEKCKFKRAKFDFKNKKILLGLYFEDVQVLGQYEVNGRILILPIQGNGPVNVTVVGFDLQYEFEYELVTRDGDEYMSSINQMADFTLKRAFFNFENLFNGNEQLGASTNAVLNKEWETFVDGLKPALKNVIVEVAKTIVNSFIANIPYNDIFPE
ncbi:hypothetical protein NQ317_000707 [Molorchus minor]|uniref:Uncharacterized protein n=1 Tax=Molorchus minor TaxID=1323400 RepID=A0ABQ9J0W3_9CUCU|nr:hypothetical protein NQ317_000707 [Molorchus minor]